MILADNWYDGVAQAMDARACTYFHAGALQRSSSFRADLLAALINRGYTTHLIEWEEVAARGWEDVYSSIGELATGHLVILWAPETVADRRDFRELLRQSRPKGQDALAVGARLLIVSARPKLFFPDPDGSSIITDGIKLRPVNVTSTVLSNLKPGLDASVAQRISSFAGGSVALAEFYLTLELAELSGNEKRRQSQEFLQNVLQLAISELGSDVMALLEHIVLECDTFDLSEDDIQDHHLAMLESAGLLRADDATGTVHLFATPWRNLAKGCLAAALRAVTIPPAEWEEIARKLFRFERMVRALLTQHLQDAHGDTWREAGLGGLGSKALNMARGDTHAAAQVVSDLHAPLDWLLLDELLDLAAATAADSGSVSGLSEREWARLKMQLVPIRNRVTHMRLPRSGDGSLVSQSLRFLETRSRTSSGLKGEGSAPGNQSWEGH